MQLAQQINNMSPSPEQPNGQGLAQGTPQLNIAAGGFGNEGTYAPANGTQGTNVGTMTAGNQTNYGAQPISSYAELVDIQGRTGSGQVIMIFFAVLFITAGGYFAYEYFVNDHNPLASLMGEDLPEVPASTRKPRIKAEVANTTEAINLEPQAPSPYGPYAYLPNPLESTRLASSRTWTAAEEETWRGGLSHRFNYQRYRTVLDVVGMKLAGSEAILWNALEEKKLWTRMRAAMGLADFGVVISTTVVEKALGKARPEAVEGYFKRFVAFASPGERYVMREAMKVVPPIAKVVILEALNKWDDSYRDIYFAAASRDESPVVAKYIAEATMARGIPKSAIDAFEQNYFSAPVKKIAPDAANKSSNTDGNNGTTPQTSGSESQQITVDGPEAAEAIDGWDAYTDDSYSGNSEEAAEVEYYNTEIMQEKAGAKKSKTKAPTDGAVKKSQVK